MNHIENECYYTSMEYEDKPFLLTVLEKYLKRETPYNLKTKQDDNLKIIN